MVYLIPYNAGSYCEARILYCAAPSFEHVPSCKAQQRAIVFNMRYASYSHHIYGALSFFIVLSVCERYLIPYGGSVNIKSTLSLLIIGKTRRQSPCVMLFIYVAVSYLFSWFLINYKFTLPVTL